MAQTRTATDPGCTSPDSGWNIIRANLSRNQVLGYTKKTLHYTG